MDGQVHVLAVEGLEHADPGHKAKPTGGKGWVDGQVHVLHGHDAHL